MADQSKIIIEKRRPTYAEQIADRCVHFTGIMNPTCAAGVKYDDVKVDHEPVAYRREQSATIYHARRSMPCHQSMNYASATCASCQFPTPEQVAAEAEESRRSIARMFGARSAIVAHIEQTGKKGGVVPCPSCGQKLGYSQASNGHIHAKCETSGCVAWME